MGLPAAVGTHGADDSDVTLETAVDHEVGVDVAGVQQVLAGRQTLSQQLRDIRRLVVYLTTQGLA